jgi:hypothetical protein
MKKYKPYLTRVDLVKNQVEREKLAEQEAKASRKKRVQQQNRERWLKYQEQLRSELAARYFHGVVSAGGESFSNTKSLSFDGIDDYIILPTITLATDFSVSMWIKATTSGSVRDQVFGGASGFFLLGTIVLNGGANANKMCYYNGSAYVALTPAIRDGKWHNIVITYNSSTTNLIAYTDGVETYNATYNAGTNNVIDRISEDTFANYWKGNLDELAVWDSELSSTDVAAIYNGGAPDDLNNSGLSRVPLSWWRLEEESGATATDSGTGGNDGTNNGATRDTDIPGS